VRASKIELPATEGRGYLEPSMRLCVLILIGTAATAFPQNARDAAYDKLRNDVRATKLVEQVSEDLKAHRYEAALKKADEAATLRPGDSVTLNARGAALSRLRRFGEAETALKAAVTADPKAFPPQYNLAEMLYLQKNYLDAVSALTSLQNRFGAQPLIKYDIYVCSALGGLKEQTADALAAMRYPQDGAAWYYAQAVDRLLAGKKAEAKRLMKIADAIHQEDAQPYRDTLVDVGLIK
jgi:tetratricopeptide (TPR) repeat protein